MFTDIVGFKYKSNPYAQATTLQAKSWRRKNQGLQMTRKGSKEGVKTFKYLVGIGYGQRVCMQVVVQHCMNGHMYAKIIRGGAYDKGIAQSASRIIIQDNCLVQNSKVALEAFKKRKINLFKIPPHSPDINVIENLFHTIKKM